MVRSSLGNKCRGGGQSGSRGSGQGGGRGNGRGSSESIDQPDFDVADDESVAHVASARRGPASQVQMPEPINREWIWIVHDQFSNQKKATRLILSILKSMWSGPWQSWKDVPVENRDRLFERFQGYFQWEDEWDAQIRSCWERFNARKFSNLLCRERNGAMEIAINKGLEVGDDFSILLDFKPKWMRTDSWKGLIEVWNTPSWKAKSIRNTQIRAESTGSRHTLGSQTFVTAKLRADKILGRDISWEEMWKQARCKKGSRPLDILSEGSSSVVEDLDAEENVQEHTEEWVDDRSRDSIEKYKGYYAEKYKEHNSKRPRFDINLWSQATGGENKGKLYGLSNVSDPLALITGTPSTSCSSSSYGYGTQNSEVQRLNKVIEELVAEKEKEKAEKEKEKAEKEAMIERMASIEAMLKLMTRHLPQ